MSMTAALGFLSPLGLKVLFSIVLEHGSFKKQSFKAKHTED